MQMEIEINRTDTEEGVSCKDSNEGKVHGDSKECQRAVLRRRDLQCQRLAPEKLRHIYSSIKFLVARGLFFSFHIRSVPAILRPLPSGLGVTRSITGNSTSRSHSLYGEFYMVSIFRSTDLQTISALEA